MVRHRLGDFAGAEAAFRRSIRIRPRDPRSRIALAALLAKQRRYPAALVEYRALLSLDLPSRVRDKVRWAVRLLEGKTRKNAP
jgi:Flp pilus assembly protein TadD